MWLLTNITTGNHLIVISEKTKYTVGRVGADLVIADDSSISRTHAFIHITTTQINDEIMELLELEDAGSKYGTFHNDGIVKGASLPKQQRISLAEGDRIRFGVLKNIWIVENKTPCIAVSALTTEHTLQLKQCMQVLGGCILSEWDDKYTHLTLMDIRLSSKVLHAILDQKPIVTCDYWCNVVQAGRRGKRTLPKVEAYAPPNPENFDLKYRGERKCVFNNLTFVFLNAHHFKKYAPIVEKAGGRSKHLNVGIQKSFLVRKDVAVIQYVPSTESQSSQTIDTIEECLKLHSRRTVPEFEIGLAIIQCSKEKYCNPAIDSANDLDHISKTAESSATQSSASGILLNGDETEVFIPETDQKSTASTHLSDKSLTISTTSRVQKTDSVTIESQTFERETIDSGDRAMSSLQVTESEQETNKRKRTSAKQVSADETTNLPTDSEDDELFNFVAKKVLVEKKTDSPLQRVTRPKRATHSPLDENESTTAAAKQTPKSCKKQLPVEINKRPPRRTVKDMSGFLEKTQAPHADAVGKITTTEDAASKPSTKRARTADIDNSDDDDLFCFGGASRSNNDVNNAKRARPSTDDGCDSDEDLFNFGGADDNEQNRFKYPIDVDASNEPIVARIKSRQIMPQPKSLPSKTSVADWLDCSLSALSYKAEQFKDEVDTVKKENNDSGVEGDSKDVEPIKGGCIVTVVSTKSLLHDRDLCSRKSMTLNDNDKTIKNFKKFSKKFHPQARRVIRTVSSTVCGSLM